MVRHLALFNERPFNSVLINGMVLGADGRKMSKSLKNYAAAPEALNKNGADASQAVGCRRRSNRLGHSVSRARRGVWQTFLS